MKAVVAVDSLYRVIMDGFRSRKRLSWKWHPQPGLRWQRKEIRFVHLRVGWEK